MWQKLLKGSWRNKNSFLSLDGDRFYPQPIFSPFFSFFPFLPLFATWPALSFTFMSSFALSDSFRHNCCSLCPITVIFLVSYKRNCYTRFGCGMVLLATFNIIYFDKLNFALGGLPSKAKHISTIYVDQKNELHRRWNSMKQLLSKFCLFWLNLTNEAGMAKKHVFFVILVISRFLGHNCLIFQNFSSKKQNKLEQITLTISNNVYFYKFLKITTPYCPYLWGAQVSTRGGRFLPSPKGSRKKNHLLMAGPLRPNPHPPRA